MWYDYIFPGSMLTGKSKKKLAKYENMLEWQNTFVKLLNLSLYTFQWDGLPETCNERYLEYALLTRGSACICDDPKRGLLSLAANPFYNINLYGDFTRIRAVGWNGYNKEYEAYLEGADNYDTAKAVLCRDNRMLYPYINYLIIATDRLTSAVRSMDIAAKKLKNPYFITCHESQLESVKQILKDVDDNVESVIVSKTTYPDMFKVFPTQLDVNVLAALRDHYNFIDNDIRTLMGIKNNDRTAKKERLVVSEVQSTEEITDMNVDMRLEQREKFCEFCNKVFGTNISVKLRKERLEDVQDLQSTGDGEGDGLGLPGSEQ